MLASRPPSRPNSAASIAGGRTHTTGSARRPPLGLRRLLYAYAAAALAAVLGLPGLAAGTITANNCQLRDLDCVGQPGYGPIAGSVLAAIVLVVLAVQFRLGWQFWTVSLLGFLAAAVSISLPWLLIAVIALWPAAASWITDPSQRRRPAARHWVPRCAVLGIPAVMIILGVWNGGLAGPGLAVRTIFG